MLLANTGLATLSRLGCFAKEKVHPFPVQDAAWDKRQAKGSDLERLSKSENMQAFEGTESGLWWWVEGWARVVGSGFGFAWWARVVGTGGGFE